MHSLACFALLHYLLLIADQVRYKVLQVISGDVPADQLLLILIFPAGTTSLVQVYSSKTWQGD